MVLVLWLCSSTHVSVTIVVVTALKNIHCHTSGMNADFVLKKRKKEGKMKEFLIWHLLPHCGISSSQCRLLSACCDAMIVRVF